jgi:hypothetical protein
MGGLVSFAEAIRGVNWGRSEMITNCTVSNRLLIYARKNLNKLQTGIITTFGI